MHLNKVIRRLVLVIAIAALAAACSTTKHVLVTAGCDAVARTQEQVCRNIIQTPEANWEVSPSLAVNSSQMRAAAFKGIHYGLRGSESYRPVSIDTPVNLWFSGVGDQAALCMLYNLYDDGKAGGGWVVIMKRGGSSWSREEIHDQLCIPAISKIEEPSQPRAIEIPTIIVD